MYSSGQPEGPGARSFISLLKLLGMEPGKWPQNTGFSLLGHYCFISASIGQDAALDLGSLLLIPSARKTQKSLSPLVIWATLNWGSLDLLG